MSLKVWDTYQYSGIHYPWCIAKGLKGFWSFNIRLLHFADLIWVDRTLTCIPPTCYVYCRLELRKKKKNTAKPELFDENCSSQQPIRNRCWYICLYISQVVIVPSFFWKDQIRDQLTVTSTLPASEEYCRRGRISSSHGCLFFSSSSSFSFLFVFFFFLFFLFTC